MAEARLSAPLSTAIAEALAARKAAARALRCLDLADLASLYRNPGAEDLRAAALAEIREQRYRYHRARGRVAITLARLCSPSLAARFTRAARHEHREAMIYLFYARKHADETR